MSSTQIIDQQILATTVPPAYRQSSDQPAPAAFSKDTEILTQRGWVLFPDLTAEDQVAQYDVETSAIDFVTPTSFREHHFSGAMKSITTEQQIDLLVTPGFKFRLRNRRSGAWKTYRPGEYREDVQQICAGHFVGGSVTMSEAMLTLIAALQADGHVRPGDGIAWAFRKQRKIDRLKAALDCAGITHSVALPDDKNTVRFSVRGKDVPDWLRNKKFFGEWILSLDQPSFAFLAHEVWFWDGCYSRQSMYSSNHKSNAGWVQILTVLSGRRARMRSYDNGNPNSVLNWQVDAASNAYSMTTNRAISDVSYDDSVYSVTTPKGTVIVRLNNVVAVQTAMQDVQ